MNEVALEAQLSELLPGKEDIVERLQDEALPNLLTADDFPTNGHNVAKQPGTEWTGAQYAALGAATLDLLERAGYERMINTRMLNRLYALGIAPLVRYFIGENRAFPTMQDYRATIGAAEVGYSTRGKFGSWTTSDYVAYAAVLEREVGGKPRAADYDRRSREDRNAPTISVLSGFFKGGVSELNEHLGYCNTKSWDQDDYVDFGAKYVEVNGAELLKHGGILVLSGQRRGPGYASIVRKFGSWDAYKTRVLAEYEERTQHTKQERAAKLSRYQTMLQAGALPAAYAKLSEDELLLYGGRHLVAQRAVPGAASYHRQNAAEAKSSQGFINALLRASQDNELTVGRIELEASVLGVYDDLWPMDQYKQFLRVTPEDIAEVNSRRNASHRAWYHSSRSDNNQTGDTAA